MSSGKTKLSSAEDLSFKHTAVRLYIVGYCSTTLEWSNLSPGSFITVVNRDFKIYLQDNRVMLLSGKGNFYFQVLSHAICESVAAKKQCTDLYSAVFPLEKKKSQLNLL